MEKIQNKKSLAGSLVYSVKIALPLHGVVSLAMAGATFSQCVGPNFNYVGNWAGFLALTQVIATASTLIVDYRINKQEQKAKTESEKQM